MRRTISVLAISMVLISGGFSFLSAADKDEKKAEPLIKTQSREVQGVVSGITSRSISLVTAVNKDGGEEEILLPFDKSVKLLHRRTLSEIKPGDTIKVNYVDQTADYGDRKEDSRKAAVITFLSPAAQDSPYKKAYEKFTVENSTSSDVSETNSTGANATGAASAGSEILPLKGEK